MIDSHLHVWSGDTRAYPFGPHDAVPAPAKAFDVDKLTDVMDQSGVTHALAIQPRVYGYDHAYLFDAARQMDGRLRTMPLLNATRPGNVQEMEALADHELVAGFRVIAIGPDPAAWLLEQAALRLWTRLAQLALPVGLLIHPAQLPVVGILAIREPGLRIVVDHLGCVSAAEWPRWREHLLRLGDLPNVYLKISALANLSDQPFPYKDMHSVVDSVLGHFGPSQLLWGSDWPYAVDFGSYDDSIRSVAQLLSPHEHEQVFAGTAAALFGFQRPGDASA